MVTSQMMLLDALGLGILVRSFWRKNTSVEGEN